MGLQYGEAVGVASTNAKDILAVRAKLIAMGKQNTMSCIDVPAEKMTKQGQNTCNCRIPYAGSNAEPLCEYLSVPVPKGDH